MSETTPTYLDEEPSSTGATGSTADVAREQASRVADTAAQSGQHVASVAKDEAVGVAQEAKYQAKDLFQQAQSSLRDQAAQQQDRVASGLRSVGDELSQMASASDSQGMASDLVRQAADRAHGVASWLEQRDPGSLLGELKSYARRSPGTFIAIAAVAGVVAGRLTRSLTSGSPDAGQRLRARPAARTARATCPPSARRRPTAAPRRADRPERATAASGLRRRDRVRNRHGRGVRDRHRDQLRRRGGLRR